MSTDLVNLSVSRRKPLKDQVTPYKLALLVLIDEHCKAVTQLKKNICSVWYSDEEELLFLTTLLNLVQVGLTLIIYFMVVARLCDSDYSHRRTVDNECDSSIITMIAVAYFHCDYHCQCYNINFTDTDSIIELCYCW